MSYKAILAMSHTCPESIILTWVSGHCNIYGKEQEDKLTRSAAELEGGIRSSSGAAVLFLFFSKKKSVSSGSQLFFFSATLNWPPAGPPTLRLMMKIKFV